MARKYTKVEILSEEVFRRKKAGGTNREIAKKEKLLKESHPQPGYPDPIYPTFQ